MTSLVRAIAVCGISSRLTGPGATTMQHPSQVCNSAACSLPICGGIRKGLAVNHLACSLQVRGSIHPRPYIHQLRYLRRTAGSQWRFTARAAEEPPNLPLEDTEFIGSTGNPYVKHCVKLRTNRKYRDSASRVMVAGTVPILEISGPDSEQPLPILVLFLASWADVELEGIDAARVVRVNEGVMKKLTGLDSVSGVHAVAEMEVTQESNLHDTAQPLHRLLVLEQLQDPGNMGTLLRTATAFGWDALYLLPGCCDPFNEKVLRASRGACFTMRRASGSWEDLQSIAKNHGLKCLAAEPDPDAKFVRWSAAGGPAVPGAGKGVALVLGSEGQGLSKTAIEACTPVSLPMPGDMESLNVGVAGGILMYLLSLGAYDLLRFGRPPDSTK